MITVSRYLQSLKAERLPDKIALAFGKKTDTISIDEYWQMVEQYSSYVSLPHEPKKPAFISIYFKDTLEKVPIGLFEDLRQLLVKKADSEYEAISNYANAFLCYMQWKKDFIYDFDKKDKYAYLLDMITLEELLWCTFFLITKLSWYTIKHRLGFLQKITTWLLIKAGLLGYTSRTGLQG